MLSGINHSGIARKFVVLFAGALASTLLGCSNASEPGNGRPENVSFNTNGSANEYSNSIYTNSSNPSNSNSNIKVNVTFAELKDELKTGLKERIRESSDNDGALTPNQWDADAWLDQAIGRFYHDDDEFAKQAVCRVTENILEQHNKKLTKDAYSRLRDGINHNLMCRKAVSNMANASLTATHIVKTP